VRGEPRSVKITALQAPQHESSLKPPGDSGDKPCGSGTIFLIGAGPEDFMQRAQSQPPAGQRAVDGLDPKRQHAVTQCIRPFDPADAVL
jgi:hypothetical protein